MKNIQKGFTLIELMIVVAIIGILAAIALPKFADMLEKSREGATKGNFTAIKSAVNLYTADQAGLFPTDLTATHAQKGADVNFLKKYLEKIPPVKATAKNEVNAPASGPGTGSELSTAAIFISADCCTPAISATTGKGWRYDSLEGKIWVNSAALDMANKSYTLYGYE